MKNPAAVQLGRIGGKSTLKKYGTAYFRNLRKLSSGRTKKVINRLDKK